MQRGPNSSLSTEEKAAKKAQKRHLKWAMRRRKLLVRMQHAEKRGEDKLAAKTRAELDAWELKRESTPIDIKAHASSPLDADGEGTLSVYAELIEQVYLPLSKLLKSEGDEKPSVSRQQRLKESKILLYNMSKGTQQEDMFANYEALCGYTRLKFSERARLVADSLTRIRDEKIWNRLKTINSMCSIGCGPGSDAVGVSLFLKNEFQEKLRRAVLLDWAVDWNRITDPLRSVVVPLLVDEMPSGRCNVLGNWDSEDNADARRLLVSRKEEQDCLSVDLVVTSYLLTETRGQWHSFYDSLLALARPGTLFLFLEPTSWQLHSLINRYPSLHTSWLDSSMHDPNLQKLERRIGPAVIVALKE